MAINLTPTPYTQHFANQLNSIPINMEQAIQFGHYFKFPVSINGVNSSGLWAPQSGDPYMQITVTNNSVSAPIAPILCDVTNDVVAPISKAPTNVFPNITNPLYSIMTELSTVQPGTTVTEAVQGIPVSRMILVLWYLAIDWYRVNPLTGSPDSNGFTATVSAVAL